MRVGRCMAVHVFMLNYGIRASASPANGWLASCANRDCLLVVVVIERSRQKVNLEHVLLPMCWIRILPQLVPTRNGQAILQPSGPTKGGSTWQWCWTSTRVG